MLPHRIGGGNDSGLLPGGRFRCHRLEVGLEAHSLYCSQLSGLPPFSCSSRRRSTVPDPATSGSYNEFEPRVVVHGSRVFVFFSSDDPGLLRGFHYAVSTNQGLSWTVSAVNYGATAPFRDLRTPDASSYNSQWLYATYDSNCDMGSPGAAPCFDSAPSYTPITVLFDSAGMLVNPTIYFPFAVDVVEPSIIAKAGQTLFVGDIDSADPAIGGPPGSHTVIWAQTPTGQNTAASWSQALFNPNFSMDVVRVDASGFGQTV